MRVEIILRSPLQHAEFGPSTGNIVGFRRLQLGETRVPCLSGNALRGRLRRILMRDLLIEVCRWDMHRPDWPHLYAALVNGGHLVGSESQTNPERAKHIRNALPAVSLLGAAFQTWMLPGRVSVGIAWPVCRETAELLRLKTREGLPAAEELVEEMSHVRHVEREQQDPKETGVTPMPVTMEVLRAGTRLVSHIVFSGGATDIERSAMAWALSRCDSLGGKSAAGLGRVSCQWDDIEISEYQKWREDGDAVERAKSALEEIGRELLKARKNA